MRYTFKNNDNAMGFLAQAVAAQDNGRPEGDVKQLLRQAVYCTYNTEPNLSGAVFVLPQNFACRRRLQGFFRGLFPESTFQIEEYEIPQQILVDAYSAYANCMQSA